MVILDMNEVVDIYLNNDLSITEGSGDTILQRNVFFIEIYPRFYTEVLDLEIYDEMKDETINIETNAVLFPNGVVRVYIDFDFQNENTYLIDLRENDKLMYKGKILSTLTQNIQEYQKHDELANGIIEI